MARLRNKILAIELITIATITGLGVHACNYIQDSAKAESRFNGVEEFMINTDDGKNVSLPIGDKSISILLNGFSEEEKQQAQTAIQELDEILDSVDYTIIENDDVKITQKIVINNNYEVEGGNLGYTSLNIDGETAQITYPIQIYIDPDCAKWHDENGNTALSYVIKHEMGHTLGLKDIHDPSYYNKTIMYYKMSDVSSYTDLDKKTLKQVYDKYYLGNNCASLFAGTDQKDNSEFTGPAM